MHLKRVLLTVVVFVAVMLGALDVSAARAAPSVVFGPPTEGAKITLTELSIDGPALWTRSDGSPRAVIAWTGTDTRHRLNIMTSDDGLHYTNKHTLSETSFVRPSVTYDSSGQAGILVLAWTGTDSAHTLNVAYYDASSFTLIRKLTFWGHTSNAAPSVAVYGSGEVALSWTDLGQTVNVLRLSNQGQNVGSVRLETFASAERPNLDYNSASGQFILSWVDPGERLQFATSTDAIQWSAYQQVGEWSEWAPSMIGLSATNMPASWLAWTGALGDTAHHLNVQYTESFPDWTNVNSKTTFGETAFGGPALGYVGVNKQVVVSWTGTDAAHHLNVAVIYVTS